MMGMLLDVVHRKVLHKLNPSKRRFSFQSFYLPTLVQKEKMVPWTEYVF